MSGKQLNTTDRVLICGVDTDISDYDIKNELLKTYQGVKRVQRWYYKDETPKDLVQVNFTSPKHAEKFLEDGCFNINNLRCLLTPLEPTMRLKNAIESNNGSNGQSKILTEEQQVTDKILVHDVPTNIADDDLRQELSKVYRGIKHVKRWYFQDEPQTPTERVQIDFVSPANTKNILENGFINVGQFSCPVTSLKPSMRLRKKLESDNGSDGQSEILTEEQQVTDKILLHNVPTNITDDDLRQELSKVYRGIKHVKRWYYKDGSEAPMERVQIDFSSPENTKTILENGFIDIGQFCCSVTALKPSMRLHEKLESNSGSDYQSQALTEQDILHTFEEQKQ